MRYAYYTLDVFTERPFGGNPLAVFPDAGGLSSETMQQVARELNLSETVFVFPPDRQEHTRRLRIFAPDMELPFAGHPTIGTACLLADLGEVSTGGGGTRVVFEEGAGPVPVSIDRAAGGSTFARLEAAHAPEIRPRAMSPAEAADLLSLRAADVLDGDEAPVAVSSGVPFLFVWLRDREALGRARLRADLWERLLASAWAPHLYLVSREAGAGGVDFRARMFAPAMGISEDPATGAAATALAAYLTARHPHDDAVLEWVVAQGVEMGRPSTLYLSGEKKGGRVTRAGVGGHAVRIAEGWMEIP